MSATLLGLFTHRPTQKQVFGLAIPMVVSNLSVPLVALVDTAVMGHSTDASALAAVAVGGSLYVMLVGIMSFLRMSTTGFSAQAYGQNQPALISQVLYQALILSILLGTLLVLAARPLSNGLLTLIAGSDSLQSQTTVFFSQRLMGLPAALANFALIGWFLGQQNARTPLVMMLCCNLINASLCALLVMVFELGVKGAAWAAVVGEYVALGLGLWLARAALRHPPTRTRLANLQTWRRLLSVNRDIFLRSLALQSVFVLIAVQGARLGETTAAANLLLLNGLLITSYALDGLAHALEALCGKAIGAKDTLSLKRALAVAGIWSGVISTCLSLSFFIFGAHFIALQTNLVEVKESALTYVPYLALMPLLAVGSYVLDGLFIGATQAAPMRNAMLLALAIALPFALLSQGLGNHGLWLSFMLFMAARTALMAVYACKLMGHWVR